MGAVTSFIGSVIDSVVAVATVILAASFPIEALILATVCSSCEHFMSEQFGVVLGWLGIKDEDIISVQVADQKLIADSGFYKNLMTQVAIEHQRTQQGIIDLLSVKSQGVRGSMSKYATYGKNTYLDGEPTTTINTIGVDNNTIRLAINSDLSVVSTIVKTDIRVPTELEWISSKLTKLYQYNPTTEELIYTDTFCYINTGYMYNFSTGKYDVTIGRPATNVTTITTTITNIDSTHDSQHVETHVVISTVEGVYSDTTTSIDTVVPIGSVSPSVAVNTTAVQVDTLILHIDSFIPAISYVTQYTIGTSDIYTWVYVIGSGNVILDAARNYLTDLDMLPIIELRRNNISITSNKTSTRYIQAKEILGFIGIDVDKIIESVESSGDINNVSSAYIYFGAELGSTNPLQAKLIYKMLSYVYDDSTLITGGSHTIRVTEGDYNSSISWETQERLTVPSTINPIGTYEGGIDHITVAGKLKYYGWVRKQETSSHYVEYRLYNVSATTAISKQGMWDVSLKVLSADTPIVMPLSSYFVKGLTPIEQGEVFPEVLRLAVYAANVQHLKYYQTEAFMNLIQIVVVIIAIAIFVFTWYTGGATSAAFMEAVGYMLAGMVVGYALKQLLASTDNPYLKAAIVVVAAVIAVETGQYTGLDTALSQTVFTANLIVEAVSQYTTHLLEEGNSKLDADKSAFHTALEARQEELTNANARYNSMLSTDDVEHLMRLGDAKPYVEGYDVAIYKAGVDFMCNWDLVKSMTLQTQLYNYDTQYRLGLVTLQS